MHLREKMIETLGRCGRAYSIVDVSAALHDLADWLETTERKATLVMLRDAIGDSAAVRL